MLACYPPLREFGERAGVDSTAHEDLATLVLVNGHELVWVDGRSSFVCLTCGASCRKERRKALESAECKGTALLAVSIMDEARCRRHSPSVAFLCDGSRAPLIACSLCGCMAEARAVGLVQPCTRGRRTSKATPTD